MRLLLFAQGDTLKAVERFMLCRIEKKSKRGWFIGRYTAGTGVGRPNYLLDWPLDDSQVTRKIWVAITRLFRMYVCLFMCCSGGCLDDLRLLQGVIKFWKSGVWSRKRICIFWRKNNSCMRRNRRDRGKLNKIKSKQCWSDESFNKSETAVK